MTWRKGSHALSSNLQMMSKGGNPFKGSTAIQAGLDSRERQAYRNLMKLNKDKCSILVWGSKEPLQWYKHCLAGEQLCRKYLGVFVDRKLNVSQQYALTAKKVNSFLG